MRCRLTVDIIRYSIPRAAPDFSHWPNDEKWVLIGRCMCPIPVFFVNSPKGNFIDVFQANIKLNIKEECLHNSLSSPLNNTSPFSMNFTICKHPSPSSVYSNSECALRKFLGWTFSLWQFLYYGVSVGTLLFCRSEETASCDAYSQPDGAVSGVYLSLSSTLHSAAYGRPHSQEVWLEVLPGGPQYQKPSRRTSSILGESVQYIHCIMLWTVWAHGTDIGSNFSSSFFLIFLYLDGLKFSALLFSWAKIVILQVAQISSTPILVN